ncbi:hypothetical protein PHISP_03718 [Aspergillus sp. HF37]|nr:hypothetical protein PHISP_03718 [Aspergillus sp. HF37]
MKRASRGPTWFEDEQFLDSEVSFPDPSASRWRLKRKIYEREYSLAGRDRETTAANGEDGNADRGERGKREREKESNEACAIYLCTRIDEPNLNPAASDDRNEGESDSQTEDKEKSEQAKPDPRPKKAIMKIRLQIPSPTAKADPVTVRASQATTCLTTLATNEIDALSALTAAQCSSTPALLAWKQDTQDCDSGVPGGFAVFMLMELLPGVRVENFMRELARDERDALRVCFREAWLEGKACGAINLDTGIRNLLWDSKRRKCYILDFELYRKPTEDDVWNDSLYLAWNLAWINDGDPNDMSTWEL